MYFDFAYLDSAGTRSVEVTVWAITLSSVRKTLSQLLLLFITSGYWIVKPTLGGKTLRMLLLGELCCVISESLAWAKHFGNTSENAWIDYLNALLGYTGNFLCSVDLQVLVENP